MKREYGIMFMLPNGVPKSSIVSATDDKINHNVFDMSPKTSPRFLKFGSSSVSPISEKNFNESAAVKAVALYHKYIKVGAIFELNISHHMRSSMIKQFHNLRLTLKQQKTLDDIQNLIFIFDPALKEVAKLLKGSFDNFQRRLIENRL